MKQFLKKYVYKYGPTFVHFDWHANKIGFINCFKMSVVALSISSPLKYEFCLTTIV